MDIIERIKSTVESAPIVLFMKGTPQFPMCGFSSRTSKVLKTIGAPFGAFDFWEELEVTDIDRRC